MEVNRVYDAYVPSPSQASVEYTPAPPPPEVKTSVVANERDVYIERDESPNLLKHAVSEINKHIANYKRHLEIRHHEPTNRRIVTVYDSDTNEAIREIPSEKALEAHATMLELVGLFVDKRR